MEVLLLLEKGATRTSKIQKYAFLKYMDVVPPIDMVDLMPLFVFRRWSTDNEVLNSLRYDTETLKQGGLILREWFGMECQQTSQGCVYVLRENHEIAQFTDMIL